MPSEESPQEQAERYVEQVRDVIRGLRNIELGPVEKSLLVGLTRLTHAVDQLVRPHSIFRLGEDDLDEYGPGQLEQVRARLFGSQPQTDAEPKFIISFPDVELSASDIWEDEEDIPEHPTPNDVIQAMCDLGIAGPNQAIRDWTLIESLYVRADYDTEAVGEVEWDGT